MAACIHSQMQPVDLVEKFFFQRSGRRDFQYPGEHIATLEVSNSFELGRLAALRFLEWAQTHPTGVIALPTGKTPEYFIKFLTHYKAHWHDVRVQADLATHGITAAAFPDATKLKFVQIDEFVGINSQQKNSFNHYVRTYYLPLLGIAEENCILMDLAALKVEDTKAVLEYCAEYEGRIRAFGGIDFFLGGIGPDGHIAFNMKGSAHDSLTRMVQLNYESAAAAAVDLGGIEYARDKHAITIGLATITAKEDATIIIMAAGEGKAAVVAGSIQVGRSADYPASVLCGHPGARFYLTKGAASRLIERQCEDLCAIADIAAAHEVVDEVLYEIAYAEHKPVRELTARDLERFPLGAVLLERGVDVAASAAAAHARLCEKIERGVQLPQGARVVHTEPHHDDVMLSYHPLAVRMLASSDNYFACLTSGFNAVTNGYIKQLLQGCSGHFVRLYEPAIFKVSYEEALRHYANAFKITDEVVLWDLECVIFARNVAGIYQCTSLKELQNRLQQLHKYFDARYPGQKDEPEVQLLKGAMRESEVDRMWALHGVAQTRIKHFRSHFYTGDYFNPVPTMHDDVQPLVALLRDVRPDIVTVAFDPEGTGPDTHYKVLQVVAEALRLCAKEGMSPAVWGYRNVWHRFTPAQATVMAPASERELQHLDRVFITCFGTQRSASFPASTYDGPFSGLSCDIAREQLLRLKILLGEEYFDSHDNEQVRNAAGMIFLSAMTLDQFLQQAEALKARTEYAG